MITHLNNLFYRRAVFNDNGERNICHSANKFTQ